MIEEPAGRVDTQNFDGFGVQRAGRASYSFSFSFRMFRIGRCFDRERLATRKIKAVCELDHLEVASVLLRRQFQFT